MSAPAAVPQTTQQTSLEDEIQSGDELNQSIFTLSIAIDDSDERLGRIPSLDCTPATEHSLDGRISSECAGSPVLRGDPYRINAVNIASLSCEFDGSDFLGIAAEDYEDGAELADQQMKKWIGATKNMPNSGDDGLRPSSTPIHEDEPRSESPRIPVPIQRHDMIKAPPKISPWLKCVTEEEGYTFYYNTLTGESSWDNPEVPVERNQYIQEDAVAMGIEGERVGGAIAQLGSAMSPPPSLAPSSSTIKSHLELIPSPAVDDSVVATISPDMSTVQVEVKPSPSKTAAQFEEQLDSVSQPAWMADAKNLMKLLQKDSPLPPPPVWGAGASLAPPPSLETVCLTEYGSGLSHPLGIGMSPGSVSGAHGDMVTPIREGGDSDSVASVRSAGSRNHHKVTPGQISPAISAGGSKNSSGQSALHITAAACNVKALALLLDGGFDPDVLDAEGRTAMMLLCSAPDLAATVGAKKKSGTPTDRLACLDALIRHGADLDSADANGNTALHLCVLTGSRCAENEGSEGEASAALAVSCIGILIDSGADISITNAEGDSPLHLAAKLGQLEMMQVIMDRSNAHHHLHPSPTSGPPRPHPSAGMHRHINSSASAITPISVISDSCYGASSIGNLTGYTTDTSDFSRSAPNTASGAKKSSVLPQSALVDAAGFHPALDRAIQYPSSELSVQSLSYSPVSTDLVRLYESDVQYVEASNIPSYVLIGTRPEIAGSDVLRIVAPQPEVFSPIGADDNAASGRVAFLSGRKIVTFADGTEIVQLPKSFIDDSVPMHQTLWDTIATSAEHPELSPWGDSGTVNLATDETSPAAYHMQFNGAELEAAEPQESGCTYAEPEDAYSYESNQPPSEWQAYQTDEGYTYYYNIVTGETRWELPAEEALQEEMAQDALYYEETVGDSDYGYAAAEDEEETPVWKQGGGMRTLAIDSRATSAYAPSLSPSTWEVGKPTSTAPHSIVRDTNAKLSLAPHSPMVLAVQKTPVGNNRSHHVSTTQRTADYVHTPVKSDDHELIMGYGIHDMSNKHLFRDGRSELMSPPVKAVASDDTLENALISPHLTRPPRITASPVPMANMYTPSKSVRNGPLYSPLTVSPTAGFFSPTAPTPRQLANDSRAMSPDVNSPILRGYVMDYSESEEVLGGQVLDYGYGDGEQAVDVEQIEAYEERSPPLTGREVAMNGPHDGTLRHQRAPSVSSLSDDQSDGSTITVKHLEVWNKFFENAIKSGQDMVNAKKRQKLLKQYQAPSHGDGRTSLRRQAAHPAGLRPSYTPIETNSRAKMGNKASGELWPEELTPEIYAELIADALMLLSRDAEETEEYAINESGHYIPLEKGPSKDDYTMGSVALIAATVHDDVETVEQLLVLGVYPSCVDSNIRTPLHHASHNGSNDIVALLNDYGADIDARDSTGQTPLHIACCYGHVDVVRALLESAATPDARSDTNGVPMHFAAASGHIDCIMLLREYGASVFAVDSYGASVLSVAEAIQPRSTQVQRMISILRSLSEADTRHQSKESAEHSAGDRKHASRQSQSLRDNSARSSPTSPDSSRGRSRRTTKAQEIKRLAEREQIRASQPGALKGDAAGRGARLLAEAVERAQAASGDGKPGRRSRVGRGMDLQREEYAYEDESSTDGNIGTDNFQRGTSPPSSVTSNSSSQKFMDPRTIKRASSDKHVSLDDTAKHRANKQPAQSHIPVKVIDTPASPPKDLSTRRDYSHSFSESDMSVAKGNGLFSKNLSEDEDDSPEEPGTSVSRTVGGMVWGVASSIFGMIAGSSDHKSLDQIPEGESINSWQPMAPPTDHELKQRGLGFYHPPSPLHRGADGEIIVPQTPRPPDIVAAELDAKVVAYKKGLTPRRDIMVPPNEVILAVDMARAAYIDPAKRPAPLNLQINPAKTLGDAGSISIPFKEQSKHNRSGSVDSTQSSGSNDYAIPIPKRANNGYSMGTSVPEGVRWRYVDVLNTGNIKKKSPSKSPKHRISTVAAINAVKGKGDGGDSQLLFSSGRDISSNRSDGGGFSSSRKASV